MQYRIGQTAEGKVTGIQPYGAFVMLDRQTSGLIHISEISDGYVRDISRYVKVGDTVTVKIIDFDAAAGQARLSLKALHHTNSRSRRRPMNRKAELPPTWLTLTLGLPDPLLSERVAVKTEAYPGRWTTHFVIASAAELDEKLLAWLVEAYAFSERK